MIEELVELLRRETAAVEAVEARLRALELVVAAGQQRFVTMASDEVETASQRLSSLELSRVLALGTAGLPADVTSSQLREHLADRDAAHALSQALDELHDATVRLTDARDRAHRAVADAASTSRARLDAAQALVGAGS